MVFRPVPAPGSTVNLHLAWPYEHAAAVIGAWQRWAPTGPDELAVVTREPLGVVGAVVPWNYPLEMAMWKLAPAIAAGNSVVLKPAEETPLTALMFAQIAVENGLPAGVLNVVTGLGPEAGAALGRHPGVTPDPGEVAEYLGMLDLSWAARFGADDDSGDE